MAESTLLYYIKRHLPQITTLKVGGGHIENLSYLFSHENIKSRWRDVPEEVASGYHLLSMQVIATKGIPIDDEVYKKEPRLQSIVPRGLCYVFQRKEETLELTSIVYPTSKFFGDDDQNDGVVVVEENELRQEVPKGCRLIGTEKANGEMFTINAVNKELDGTYHIVLGSKNNKFLYSINWKSTTMTDVKKMIKSYLNIHTQNSPYPEIDMKGDRKWCYDNVWVEMSEYMLGLMLSKPEAAEKFCERLLTEKLTACGEFESWLHPHVVHLSEGHRSVRFFAMTSYQEDGSPVETSGAERMKQLDWITETGFDTVTKNELPSDTDIMGLRREVWSRRNSEGLVLLVLDQNTGSIQRMFKMKTIWYVVHRGYRERLRRFVTGRNSKLKGQERYDTMRKELNSVLKSKMDIFGSSADEKWLATVDRLVTAVTEVEKSGRMKEVFSFEYPMLVARADG